MIVVVGGGISGLALGRELAARGREFVVLEAGDRVGGVIRSREVDGHLLDWGPQRTRLTRAMRALVDEVGLGPQVVSAPSGLDLFVYRHGRLRRVPFSAGAFLRSDVVGPGAKLRAALEPLTAGADPTESVATYFTRKVGRELYETLVGPLYGGLYGSDPRDMVVGLSLGHVLEEFGVGRSLVMKLMRGGGRIVPPPACSFTRGMAALPEAVAAALGGRVRRSARVEALRPNGGGWDVHTSAGSFHATDVVLCVPAPQAAALLEPVAADAARRVASLRYNPLGVVHLRAETTLKGMGFQVSFAEPLALRGVTYNDSLFARKNVYTAYLGGGVRPEVAALDDRALGRLAVDEFRLCTGFDAEPIAVAQERMPAWDRTWSALAGLGLPPGLHLDANWESRPGLPGRLARARTVAERLASRRDTASGSTMRGGA